MSAVVIPIKGGQRVLDVAPERPVPLTEGTVAEPMTLVRLLRSLLDQVSDLRRRFWPARIDFEDVVLDATGTVVFPFEHRFGGRARFWIVDWSGAAAPNLRKHTSSTDDVLRLTSTVAGTATIRVEAAG